MVKHAAHNSTDVGSNPTKPIIFSIKVLIKFVLVFYF